MRKLIISIFAILVQINTNGQNEIISCDSLKKDLYQLLTLIESTHPDPYIYAGGKIAFHRRYQQTLEKISVDGMTMEEFFALIFPSFPVLEIVIQVCFPIRNRVKKQASPLNLK